MIDPPLDHWFWLIPAFLLGSCIGSFLNVVIYRVPLGMSVNEPKRSFCPTCRKAIPMSLNLPLISWLWLRGKCAECKSPISFRYFAVELLTAVLFAAIWWCFPPQVAPLLWVVVALFISISFIDADHMIIPTGMTWAGTAIGLIACMLWPSLPALGSGEQANWLDGLIRGGIGFGVGFFGLWVVVVVGKMAFGRRQLEYDGVVEWSLVEPDNDVDPLRFVIDGEANDWWDMFNRPGDRLIIEAGEIRVDGEPVKGGTLTIREKSIELPGGEVRQIEQLKSLEGKASSVVIPREAMGFGDVHLMGMIGACLGWTAVVYSLFAASLLAIVSAISGRIGFGRPLPFGPFLCMGALIWAFGGWKLWVWYMDWLGPLWSQTPTLVQP